MSTLIEDPVRADRSSSADRLRLAMAAVRLAFTWFGVRKSLSTEQKAQAAETFNADGGFLSAGKKTIDTSHAAFKAVTSLRNQIAGYWRSMTVPYPEPGIRLIRRDDLEPFDIKLTSLRQELDEAVNNLNDHYSELKAAARRRLGSLYNAGDYPGSLIGLFNVTWEFPSVEPPSYLRQLSPALFEEESRRVSARFQEAVQLAEQAFTEEFNKLVSHLTERLSGSDDGKPKVFRDSAVVNLVEFFQRFKHLNVQSNEQLDQLIEQAQRIVRNVRPDDLRDNQSLRDRIARQLTGVQSQLDGMLVDRPRRNILRRTS